MAAAGFRGLLARLAEGTTYDIGFGNRTNRQNRAVPPPETSANVTRYVKPPERSSRCPPRALSLPDTNPAMRE